MGSAVRRPLRLILIWVLLELMAAAQVQRGPSTVLTTWLRAVGTPVVAAATGTARLVENIIVGLGEGVHLVSEHQRLRHQLELARAREHILSHELEELTAEQRLASTAARLSGRAIAARCRYRELGAGRLEITGGARDGLRPDQPVLSAEGIVGRVWRVGAETSWVQTLTAPSAAVAVTSEAEDLEAVAVGRGRRTLGIEYVSPNRELFVGQVLLSSGSEGLYPPGVPVARVVDIRGSDDAFLDIAAQPTTDMESLRVVLVLRGWQGGEVGR